jgi:hypothetical protein
VDYQRTKAAGTPVNVFIQYVLHIEGEVIQVVNSQGFALDVQFSPDLSFSTLKVGAYLASDTIFVRSEIMAAQGGAIYSLPPTDINIYINTFDFAWVCTTSDGSTPSLIAGGCAIPSGTVIPLGHVGAVSNNNIIQGGVGVAGHTYGPFTVYQGPSFTATIGSIFSGASFAAANLATDLAGVGQTQFFIEVNSSIAGSKRSALLRFSLEEPQSERQVSNSAAPGVGAASIVIDTHNQQSSPITKGPSGAICDATCMVAAAVGGLLLILIVLVVILLVRRRVQRRHQDELDFSDLNSN